MDEEVLNMSIRKFLKRVGINAQREIESNIREALKTGKIDDNSTVKVSMSLSINQQQAEDLVIEGDIHLK